MNYLRKQLTAINTLRKQQRTRRFEASRAPHRIWHAACNVALAEGRQPVRAPK